jgi:rhodanese-related sulfurtransferase
MTRHRLLTLSLLLLMLLNISLVCAEDTAPLKVPGAITIGTETARLLHNKGYPFVDVRGMKHFGNGHIPGAIHLAIHSEEFTAENLRKVAEKDQLVVFYCNGITCMGSSIASEKAVKWGWKQVAYYRTGIPHWQEQGLAIE